MLWQSNRYCCGIAELHYFGEMQVRIVKDEHGNRKLDENGNQIVQYAWPESIEDTGKKLDALLNEMSRLRSAPAFIMACLTSGQKERFEPLLLARDFNMVASGINKNHNSELFMYIRTNKAPDVQSRLPSGYFSTDDIKKLFKGATVEAA